MNIVENIIYRLQEFEQSIESNIADIVRKYDYIIIDMNVQDQLYERGIDRNGNSLPEYLPITVRVKQTRGQPFDRTTLRDTGEFHRSWTIRIADTFFEIVPEDIKTELLVAKYGEEIIGLTDENFNEFCWEYVYPELLQKLRDSLS